MDRRAFVKAAAMAAGGARFAAERQIHLVETGFANARDHAFMAPPERYERGRRSSKLPVARLLPGGAPPAGEAGRKRKSEVLNRTGALAAKSGMMLAYHNREPEVEHARGDRVPGARSPLLCFGQRPASKPGDSAVRPARCSVAALLEERISYDHDNDSDHAQ